MDDATHPNQISAPSWLLALGWLLPAGILAQFLSAGLGLFLDASLIGLHAAIGFSLSLPILALLAATLLDRRLRPLAGWSGLVMVLYTTQIGLAAGAAPVPMSLHPLNGALVLVASLMLLARLRLPVGSGFRHSG